MADSPREPEVPAGRSAPALVRKGTTSAEGLAEVLRRRKEACQEFESAPPTSSADAPLGSGTGVASGSGSGSGAAKKPANATPHGEGSLASKPGQAAFTRVSGNSAAEMKDWMQRMKDRCQTLESSPTAGVADATASMADHAAVKKSTSAAAPTRTPHKGNSQADLEGWMAKLKGRCQVLESSPTAGVADVAWSYQGVFKAEPIAGQVLESTPTMSVADVRSSDRGGFAADPGAGQVLESTPSISRADARSGEHKSCLDAGLVLESKPAPGTADASYDNALRSENAAAAERVVNLVRAADARIPTADPVLASRSSTTIQAMPEIGEPPQELAGARADGQDLMSENPQDLGNLEVHEPPSAPVLAPTAGRLRIWAEHLNVSVPTFISEQPRPPPTLEEVEACAETFAFGNDAPKAPVSLLMLLLACTVGASATGALGHNLATTFGELAIAFTVKHLAWIAEGAENADVQVFAVIAQLLRYHYPVAAATLESTFVQTGVELAEALSAACNGACGLAELLFVVADGDKDAQDFTLLLCDSVIAEEQEMMLLFAAVVLFERTATSNPEAALRQLKEGSLGTRTADLSQSVVDDARSLQEATPLSLLSALAQGSTAGARLRLPICGIAPDEVLHHIYERTSGPWRLVVVDVRCGDSPLALPVCLRLDVEQDRRAIVADLPYDASIHLCFMSDGAPVSGEEALELCNDLVSGPVYRKHVSVVEGGWVAVHALAQILGLELMRVDDGTMVSVALAPEAKAAKEKSVAAIAEQGSKAAKRFFKSATRTLAKNVQKLQGDATPTERSGG